MAEKEAAKLEAAEKRRLEKEIKKTKALAKNTQDEKAKRIETAIKIEEKAKKNIKNAAEKKQSLKCKAALASIGRPSEKKMKKELNNPPAETLAKKDDTANDQSSIPSSLSRLSGLSSDPLGFLSSLSGLSLFTILDIYPSSRLKLFQLS